MNTIFNPDPYFWVMIYLFWVHCQPTASIYQLSHLRTCLELNPGLKGGRRECYHSATVAPFLGYEYGPRKYPQKMVDFNQKLLPRAKHLYLLKKAMICKWTDIQQWLSGYQVWYLITDCHLCVGSTNISGKYYSPIPV